MPFSYVFSKNFFLTSLFSAEYIVIGLIGVPDSGGFDHIGQKAPWVRDFLEK